MSSTETSVVSTDSGQLSSLGEKQAYTQPELVEWGSLVDLTRGPDPGTITDLDFSGTSAQAT